jgi:hypothetical protein
VLDCDVNEAQTEVESIMIESMKTVVPGINVTVEGDSSFRYKK